MTDQNSFQPSLQIKFESEKLKRTIRECDDMQVLREIAIELVKLNQQKKAMLDWTTKKILEAENFRKYYH